MAQRDQNLGGAGGNAGGEPESAAAKGGAKRRWLRMEIPAVLDDALTRYAEAVALGKGAAARSLLMRVLVKRAVRVPEPANEPE